MRQIYLISIVMTAMLTACSGTSQVDVIASAQVVMATGVRLTLDAMPTETSTATATTTQFPTETPITLSPATATATLIIGLGTQANALPTTLSATEKADKSDNSTVVLLQNNTDQVIWLVIYSPVYLEYRFSDSFSILLPIGEYHYRAWIGSKGPFEGTFRISNHDKHTLMFSAGKVQFQGP